MPYSKKIPKIMSGVVLSGHGGTEKLIWRDDIPVPSLGKTDVLVQVRAAAINNTDINTRTAWYSKNDHQSKDASWSGQSLTFPRIQGADVCGEIVAVGDNINSQRIGERVLIEPCIREANGNSLKKAWYFGSECDGGFAQYTCVAARHAYKINSKLRDIELSSFPCSYSTAENMLTRANVKANDIVLITGASGGVGSAAVQLAKARKAIVIGITTPSKAEVLKGLGLDTVLYRNTDLPLELGTNSVDVVIDLVAGPNWPSLLEVLKPNGRYAVAGAIGGSHVKLDIRTLYLKDLSFFGCTVLEPEVFSNLIKRIERQEIKPLIEKTYSLRDIKLAQQFFIEKKHIGKIVLEVM